MLVAWTFSSSRKSPAIIMYLGQVSHTRGLNHEKRRRNWEPTSIMHTLAPVKYPSFARYCLPNWLNSFPIAPTSLQLLATASAPRLGLHIRELAMAKMRIESAPTAASLSMINGGNRTRAHELTDSFRQRLTSKSVNYERK